MNLLENYESDASGGGEQQIIQIERSEVAVNLAPQCDVNQIIQSKERERKKYLEQIYKEEKKNNHLTGRIEHQHMNHFIFDEQFNNFKNIGVAVDPCANRLITNSELVDSKGVKEVEDLIQYKQKSSLMSRNKQENERKKEIKGKRQSNWHSGSSDFKGPWAGYTDVEKLIEQDDEVIKHHKDVLNKLEEKRHRKMEEQIENQAKKEEVQSVFHGKELVDY